MIVLVGIFCFAAYGWREAHLTWKPFALAAGLSAGWVAITTALTMSDAKAMGDDPMELWAPTRITLLFAINFGFLAIAALAGYGAAKLRKKP